MKFVSESIEDILKPKSSEEINKFEEEAISKVEALFSYVEDIIQFLEQEEEKHELVFWRSRYEEAHSRLLEGFYSLPEYIQNRYSERFDMLHNKLDHLVGNKTEFNFGKGVRKVMSELKRLGY